MKRLLIVIALLIWATPSQAVYVLGSGASAGGGGGPTLIFDDTLYEGSLINITAHTVAPGPGGTWAQRSGSTVQISTEGVQLASAYTTSLATNPTTITNGYVIGHGNFGGSTSSFHFAVGARFDASTINGYLAILLGTDVFTLRRIDNNVSTQIGSDASGCGDVTPTTKYTIKLIVSGSTITGELYDDAGTTLICSTTTTDSTYTTGGVALRMSGQQARMDSLKAYSE